MMLRSFHIRFPFVYIALVFAAITGCTVARQPNAIPARELRENPRLAEGQHAFMRYCNQCHPGGAGGVGISLTDKRIPPFFTRLKVRHSIGAMPRFSSDVLPDARLDDVITYLRYLRLHAGELEG